MALTTDWNPHLRAEFTKPYWAELQQFVANERAHGTVYPPAPEVFAALHATALSDVKAVILGQDPYHGPGQAHGLCFSVRPDVEIPPSLRNIYRELHDDVGVPFPQHGCLTGWAQRGVLLLNTTLTVRRGAAASHRGKGWETFTDRVIEQVNAKDSPVVFILWGSAARQKSVMVDQSKHFVISSAHPSPLSAHRGFLGSRPFSRANAFLVANGLDPLDWSIGSAEATVN